MSVSQIKRGIYTRVDASGIESNKGTYFEAIMSPKYSIQMSMDAAGTTVLTTFVHTSCSITDVAGFKIDAGGAGDQLVLSRIRDGSTDVITALDVASATSGGEYLVPDLIDSDYTSLQPGDKLELTGTAAAGVPTCDVYIGVRID